MKWETIKSCYFRYLFSKHKGTQCHWYRATETGLSHYPVTGLQCQQIWPAVYLKCWKDTNTAAEVGDVTMFTTFRHRMCSLEAYNWRRYIFCKQGSTWLLILLSFNDLLPGEIQVYIQDAVAAVLLQVTCFTKLYINFFLMMTAAPYQLHHSPDQFMAFKLRPYRKWFTVTWRTIRHL